MCFSLLAFSDFNDSFIPQLRMTLFFLFGFLTQNFRDQMIVSSNRYYSLVPSVPHLVCWVVWGFLVGWLVDFFVGFWVGWLGFFFFEVSSQTSLNIPLMYIVYMHIPVLSYIVTQAVLPRENY